MGGFCAGLSVGWSSEDLSAVVSVRIYKITIEQMDKRMDGRIDGCKLHIDGTGQRVSLPERFRPCHAMPCTHDL